jgi:hypothetical protein
MNFDSYTYASSNNVCKEFTIYNKKVDKHIHAIVSILYDEDEDCRTQKLVAFNESKNKYDLFEVACIVRHLPNVFGVDVNNALSGINLLMVDLLHDESTATTIQQPNILDDDDIQKDHKLMYDDMDKYVLQPLTFPRDSLPRDSLPRDYLPRDTRFCPSQKPIHIKSKNKEKNMIHSLGNLVLMSKTKNSSFGNQENLRAKKESYQNSGLRYSAESFNEDFDYLKVDQRQKKISEDIVRVLRGQKIF